MTTTPFKNRTIDLDAPIEVYLNLHKKDGDGKSWYSIRQRGKVVAHADRIDLRSPYFVVKEKGRDRVRREQRKNVHAWVQGFYAGTKFNFAKTPVSYNPMRDDQFMCQGKPIQGAGHARLEVGGKVFVYRA